MRDRKEIEESNKTGFANGDKVVETTVTRPGETLLLEVLLDIRDLLEPKGYTGKPRINSPK